MQTNFSFKEVKSSLKLFKNLTCPSSDYAIRNYKYFSSIDLNLSMFSLHSTLKWKVLNSLKRAKSIRKLKIDDENVESSKVFKAYCKVLLKQTQNVKVFSHSLQNIDEDLDFSKQIKKLVIKLKSLEKYNNSLLTPRELLQIQRKIRALDLMSSKFSGEQFKKIISYLLEHKASFPCVEELFLSMRLSRNRENILNDLPFLLQNPKINNVTLALLYAKRLPGFVTIPNSSRRKVKELGLLVETNYNITDVLPNILAFQNLKHLSLANPFQGFYVNKVDCLNWKAIETLQNLEFLSIEINLDSQDVESLALLMGYISFPKRLATLRLSLMFVPIEDLLGNYYGCFEKFVRQIVRLENLTKLNMLFESEKSRRLHELENLLCTALNNQRKLKEVSLGFPEPRFDTNRIRCHGVLNIIKIIEALKNSSHCLEKLEIGSVKGELKDFNEMVKFERLKKISISISEKMSESYVFKKLLETFNENSLTKLHLKLKMLITKEDLLPLKKLEKLEYLKLTVLGEFIGDLLSFLREALLSCFCLEEIWLKFPELDVKEESRIEEMIMVLMNKKRLRKINVKTKYFKYSYDGNIDCYFDSNENKRKEYRKMMWLMN